MPLPTQTVPRVPGEQEQGDPTEAEGITLSSHSAQELPVFLGLFILAIVTQSSSSSCPLKTQTQSSVQPQHQHQNIHLGAVFPHFSPNPCSPTAALGAAQHQGTSKHFPRNKSKPSLPSCTPSLPWAPSVLLELQAGSCAKSPAPIPASPLSSGHSNPASSVLDTAFYNPATDCDKPRAAFPAVNSLFCTSFGNYYFHSSFCCLSDLTGVSQRMVQSWYKAGKQNQPVPPSQQSGELLGFIF